MPTIPALPPDPSRILDASFLETRAKLIEIAANLDRVDRAGGLPAGDARLAFIQGALKILQSPSPNRAEQIQRLYSKD